MTINLEKKMTALEFFGMENTSSFYYDQTDEKKSELLNTVKKWISEQEEPRFKKMGNIVRRNVKHYHADFYIHDLSALINSSWSGSKNFLWFTRDCGTYLASLEDTYFYDGEVWRTLHDSKQYIKNSSSAYYIKDQKVVKIDEEKMYELLEKFHPQK